MIDLANQMVVYGEKREPIIKWTVAFKTPFGYCETLNEAIVTVESAKLSSHMVIQPVSVAYSESMSEVYDH